MAKPSSRFTIAEEGTRGPGWMHDISPIQDRIKIKQNATKQSTPSSSEAGFFQSPPRLLNQLIDDIALQRSLTLFLPRQICEEVTPELGAFGDKVLSKPVLDMLADAEKNLPYVKQFDAWGRRHDELVTSEGWRKLSDIGIEEGMVGIGYHNQYSQFSRPWQFLKYLVWTGSSAWVTCPSQMTDGVATHLRRHLSDPSLDEQSRKAFQSAYDHTTSRDPAFAWTTGQWMTERQGGSDVSQTETLAEYAPELSERDVQSSGSDGIPLGPWLCNGFKWFSSATDSSMMVFLARTPKGISMFYAPMRRTVSDSSTSPYPLQDLKTELNGIQIQRLKNKLGTKALPTAELVLKDVRAYLLGEEGKGVREVATVLNIARLHNGVTATGYWGRGLSIIRAFARVRKVGLKPLWSKPAFTRTLARLHADYKAYTLFSIFVTAALGITEQAEIAEYQKVTNSSQKVPPTPRATDVLPDPKAAIHLFRLLASVLKGLASKAGISGLQECMECMGGVGYLESEDMQFNVARLYRDVNVCSIWEGTTDMMADDVLRVMYGKMKDEVTAAVDDWVQHMLKGATSPLKSEAELIRALWQEFLDTVQTHKRTDLEARARTLMEMLGDVVMGSLMILDASRDGDRVAIDTAHAWFEEKSLGAVSPKAGREWQDAFPRDMRIVFGVESLEEAKAKL